MRNIAIIFLIDEWNEAYSLTSIVKSQIRSLVRHGYRPRVLIYQNCSPWLFRNKVNYRPCIPQIRYDFDKDRADASFFRSVRNVAGILKENLKDIDTVLVHDVLFFDFFLPYNLALRKAAKGLKDIRWLHWCHSGPSKPSRRGYPYSMLYKGMPNTTFISVAKAHRKGFSKMYGVPIDRVKTVYNPRTTEDFLGLSALSAQIVQKTDLLAADIVDVVPAAIFRMSKQVEICVYIMAALKKEGKSVRLIFVNPFGQSSGYKHVACLLHLQWLAHKVGLTDKEVFFTSELDLALANGCPENVMKDLFSLSTIYIHPSLGEACSLTLLESAITKNLCILNKNLPTFKEIAGDDAIWIKCDNLIYGFKKAGYSLRYYYSHYVKNKAYYQRLAKKIVRHLKKDKPLSFFTKVKKEFNEDFIFETQLKPLLEE